MHGSVWMGGCKLEMKKRVDRLHKIYTRTKQTFLYDYALSLFDESLIWPG